MTTLLKRRKMAADANGFTLLEVLVGMVIATVGLLAVAMMQGTAVKGNKYGNQLTQATVLAQDLLEQLNSAELSPNDAVDTMLKVGITDEETTEDIAGDGGTVYTRSYNVANNTTYSRVVNVTVSWTNIDFRRNGNATHTFTFSTITRGGMN